ncbi:MAG TPA: RNA polymerase sigma factor [Alphaproteobacteria bacterium]|nr:RNA polymerase sigma factor [Alphaproteobacteria bacterium]HNS44386.1 RNA polymerase sigma factor [Alphaproteobacteria bacterium]
MKDGCEQETELLTHARNGDSRAFRDLLDAHYMTIYRMAFRFCGNKEDAEDVTQMTCIKLAQTIASFKGEANFTTWLYTVVLNTARDWKRTQGRHERGAVGLETVENIVQINNQTPEQQLETNQKMEAVYNLPEPEREIVWLVYGEGLSHKQVAEIMGCAEGTISWRISEARKILKEGGKL